MPRAPECVDLNRAVPLTVTNGSGRYTPRYSLALSGTPSTTSAAGTEPRIGALAPLAVEPLTAGLAEAATSTEDESGGNDDDDDEEEEEEEKRKEGVEASVLNLDPKCNLESEFWEGGLKVKTGGAATVEDCSSYSLLLLKV